MAIALPSTLKVMRTRLTIQWLHTPDIRTRGGEVQTVSFGQAFWRAEWTTPASLTTEEMLSLQAWFDGMEGGVVNTFLAHDFANEYGINYPIGFTPFNGIAGCSAIAARTITITGLPASHVIKRGDYISLVQSSRYSLHRVTADLTANGSGIATGVTVTPPIDTDLFSTSAVVNMAKPLGEFVPVPDSWSSEAVYRDAPGIQVTFGGVSKVGP